MESGREGERESRRWKVGERENRRVRERKNESVLVQNELADE